MLQFSIELILFFIVQNLNYATDTLRLLVAYVADYLDLNKKSTTNSYTGI